VKVLTRHAPYEKYIGKWVEEDSLLNCEAFEAVFVYHLSCSTVFSRHHAGGKTLCHPSPASRLSSGAKCSITRRTEGSTTASRLQHFGLEHKWGYPRRQTYRLNSSSEGTYARVPVHSGFRGRIIHHFPQLREVPTQGFSYEISGVLLVVRRHPSLPSGLLLNIKDFHEKQIVNSISS